MNTEVEAEAGVEGEVGGGRDWGRYDPERLAVYRLARRHTRAICEMLGEADTRGFAFEVSQTRRSTASITSNVKEGYGEESLARKLHYYAYAKASVSETWAHVDNLVDFGCISEDAITEIRDIQNQVMALLVTMIRNLRSRLESD